MSNSSAGSYKTTPERTMAAFDKLPPTIRAELAKSASDWAVEPLLTECLQEERRYPCGYRARVADICKRIRDFDLKTVAKDARKLYGPDHPQAVPAIKSKRRKRV